MPLLRKILDGLLDFSRFYQTVGKFGGINFYLVDTKPFAQCLVANFQQSKILSLCDDKSEKFMVEISWLII